MRVATFVMLLPCLLLTACGSSSPSAAPTATTVTGYTDPQVSVTVHVARVLSTPTTSYLLISLVNGGPHTFQAGATVQFLDSALVEPTTRGTVGACDADSTHGAALQYNTIPAGRAHRGWIRCDYPRGSHILAVFWHSHEIGAYRVPS